MAITRISSREFNQDLSAAKAASRKGPVIITDRGRPAHVLLMFEDYEKLTGEGATIVDLLAGAEDIDFEPPRLGDDMTRRVGLS